MGELASRRSRHRSLAEFFSASHSFDTYSAQLHSLSFTMYASAFALSALQLLVLAASALPTNLTSRDDYYGDVCRKAFPP